MLRASKDPVAGDRDRVQEGNDSADADQLTRQPAAREAKLSGWYANLKFCIDHFHILNSWEADFILGLGGYSHPSEKQRAKLAVIINKIDFALTVIGRRRRAKQ
jgi:hypothetical protein